MSTVATEPARRPPALFSRPDADIILASSDNTHFRIHRHILSIASPLFEDMFNLPQPAATSRPDSLPIITVEENAKTLEDLLRIVYPVRDPPLAIHVLTDWQHMDCLAQAALKYDMVEAVEFMKAILMDGVESSPLEVFCISCKHGWEGAAKSASAQLISERNKRLLSAYVPQLEDISAACYHSLRQAADRHTIENINLCSQKALKRWSTDHDDLPVYYRVRGPGNADVKERTVRTADGVFYNVPQSTSCLFQRRLPDPDDLILYDATSSPMKQKDPKTPSQLIMTLPEDSRTLELLLRQEIEGPDEYALLISGLCSAAKYQMWRSYAALTKRWQELSAQNPLRSYLLAAAHGLDDQVIVTAKRLLLWDAKRLRTEYDPEMEFVSAGHYWRLLQYHQRCVDAANTARLKSWTKAFPADVPRHCPGGRCGGSSSARSRWVETCFARFKASQDRPRETMADDVALVGLLCMQAGSCSCCAECVSPTDIINLLRVVDKEMQEVVNKVSTSILFKDSMH